jgi:hypothetical protein
MYPLPYPVAQLRPAARARHRIAVWRRIKVGVFVAGTAGWLAYTLWPT